MLGVWVAAARPATLWAAVAPVLIGAALAADARVFDWLTFVVILFAAMAIQIGVNFANDLADAAKGADTAARIGPRRAVSSGLVTPEAMRAAIVVAFGAASAGGVYLIDKGGWPVAVIGIVSIIAALGYTNGPVPYGYYGYGEAFVFVFFGLVATAGSRYVFDRTVPGAVWGPAVAMGLLATAILVANNIRDLDTDAVAGKRTLAVRLGRSATAWFYIICLFGAFASIPLAVLVGSSAPRTLVVLVAAPLAVPMTRTIRAATDGPALIGVLKQTARLQLVVALLIVAGILWV